MQCPKCRAAMPNGAKYCTECGAKLPVQPDSVPNVPQPSIQEAPAYEAQPVMTEAPPVTTQDPRLAPQDAPVRLGWYKFLIYFALWAGAIVNLIDSLQFFTGSVLGDDVEILYASYPLLKVLNLVFALLLVAYAVFAIYTRYRLAQFRRNGPACLHALYLVQLAMVLIYWLAGSLILGEWLDLASGFSDLISSIVILCINIVYFRKRKHLFVN